MLKDLLWFIGVVENNFDQRLEGRVQVRAFGFHGTVADIPTQDLPWATLVHGSFDPNAPVPPLNSWVIGAFIDGRDAQQPLIFGILPNQMTNAINPSETGWGNINVDHYDRVAMGSRTSDIGQPMNSRLTRGEEIEKTYVLAQATTRVTGIETASGTTWDEPAPAYAAAYPHNRVIETPGGSVIEMDDTPGSERIMLYHQAGSFIQIDTRGTTTHKTASDKYTIIEGNGHTHVGGGSTVTIEGDCEILVKGNKIERIQGDYTQIVHGNLEIASAGQLNINASDHAQIGGARVAISARVEHVSMSSGKDVRISGPAGVHISSDGPIVASSAAKLSLSGEGSAVLSSGGKVSVSGSTVALDDIVTMANGESDSADAAISAGGATLSEPPQKMIGGAFGKPKPSLASGGYTANDDPQDSYDNTALSTCGSANLLDEIKRTETFTPKAYWDHKQWSIGYGIKTDNPNEQIDEQEAARRLESRVSSDRSKVVEYGKSKGYNWSDCQVDALTSFAYNLGFGAIDSVTAGGSRSDSEIAAKMLEYNKASGSVSPGLVKRRENESNWFLTGMGTAV